MNSRTTQAGFSLIEMIVSLGLFSVVITISVGALLILISSNQILQTEQSIMTNLSFALDSMTREVRTGTHYYCTASNSQSGMFAANYNPDSIDVFTTQDCAGRSSGQNYIGLSFVEGGESITSATANRILYYYSDVDGRLYRKVGTNPGRPITGSGIFIKDFQMYVTGSATQEATGDNEQPTVTMYIEAAESSAADAKSYFVQTTVTQRILDI